MEPSLSRNAWVVQDASQQKLAGRCIAAALQRAGVHVHLVDLNEGIANLVAAAQRQEPELIVGSLLFADRVEEHLALFTALRAGGIRAHMTLAGHFPALASEPLLAACPALDTVVAGEAELVVPQLVESLDRPDGWTSISGLVCRGSHPSDCSIASPNLDDLYPPWREDEIPSFHGYGYATVEASRGCYHACTFCLPSAFYDRIGKPYRLRRVSHLMQEIDALYARGVRLFLFDDEQFLPLGQARRKRIDALAEELARRKFRIAFTIKCRADDVEVSLFRELKDMGLVRVYVGIESGDQAALDALGKRVTVQQNAEALATLDELGIIADWRSLIFHPWSNLETIRNEIRFLRRVCPSLSTVLDWRELEIYPGTSVADRLSRERKREHAGWSWRYWISDPRVEVLRRLFRVVFDAYGAYGDLQRRFTAAWFDCLLQHRFEPSPLDGRVRLQVRSHVARANEQALALWEEMFAFVETGDGFRSTEEVDARASEWAGRVRLIAS